MTDVFFIAKLRRKCRQLTLIAAMCSTTLALGGCSTSGNLLDNFGSATPAPTAAIAPTAPTRKNVAFAPLIGAPANISQQLAASISSAVQKQHVPVITKSGAASDYTVRGYLVASPDPAGTKLSYIWDVTDPAGKRAHRITGEEFVKGKAGSNPWSNVDTTVINGIANKTATQLAAWVPPANPPAGGATATGIGGPTPVASKVSPIPLSTASTGPAQTPAAKPASIKTAGAAKGVLPVLAMIPPVTGAPGDGQRALAEALKRKLSSRGIPLTTRASTQTYTVKGNVALGKPSGGKQDINIEWLVLDPKGQRVGTVAQKNKIPQGSLSGKWGKTADAAATAAAQGVAKLLPKTVRVN